jgi:hypothetical protein
LQWQKCDEQKNINGHCKTCVRLRLECLGFGPKRPDYLKVIIHSLAGRYRPYFARFSFFACSSFLMLTVERLQESGNVTELRGKIKCFLASQGMIKGHSGSGPRSIQREPIVLRLVDEYSSGSSDSSDGSPSPTFSLPDDSHPQRTSNTRNEMPWPNHGMYPTLSETDGE